LKLSQVPQRNATSSHIVAENLDENRSAANTGVYFDEDVKPSESTDTGEDLNEYDEPPYELTGDLQCEHGFYP